MTSDALFCTLGTADIARLIRGAKRAVCYAGPGIQPDVAQAMEETSGRLVSEMLTVCLDFDERVYANGLRRDWRSEILAGSRHQRPQCPSPAFLTPTKSKGLHRKPRARQPKPPG